MAKSSLQKLKELGQSVWLDDINREMLENGELIELIERDSVSGITSNPAIFEKAITDSTAYDDAIASLKKSNVPPIAIYETLALEDVRKAADLFYPVFERSKGRDGFVSLEVSPYLANDTEQSIQEGKRLWEELNRPNTLIKVPATEAGLPVIEQLIAEGINVNVTLIFSVLRYQQVVEAFLRGLEIRVKQNKPIDHIVSVASFFLSRIDVMIDKQLDEQAAKAMIDAILSYVAKLPFPAHALPINIIANGFKANVGKLCQSWEQTLRHCYGLALVLKIKVIAISNMSRRLWQRIPSPRFHKKH